MVTIRLEKDQWQVDLDKPLAPAGGFGQVFEGAGKGGRQVAVKLLNVSADDVGHRELSIAKELVGRNLDHVIPIYDSGMDAESGRYFIVMAKAKSSLQSHLTKRKISEDEAITILKDIAAGLNEISDIVHRDLKPANILLHERKWKLADLGIARFIEKSTSLNTLKGFLSKEYAAPEQWNLETASHETDVYALGCIGFALLTGNPPFVGGDLRNRHLAEEPPRPPASPKFQQLLLTCLRKNRSARPSVKSVLNQLSSMQAIPKAPTSVLASAGAVIAREQSEAEAKAAEEYMRIQDRHRLGEDALQTLRFIIDVLVKAIKNEAPVSQVSRGGKSIILGYGQLSIDIPFGYLDPGVFKNWKKDILCGAFLKIHQNSSIYLGRSANLWFGDLEGPQSFGWWEMSYWSWSTARYVPFGFDDGEGLRDADRAAAPGLHSVSLAHKPKRIDGEYMDEFIGRWSTYLAMAAQNQLQRPLRLPEE